MASLVLGIVGFLVITAILAVIFGVLGRRKAKERPQRGTTMAAWGIALGAIWLVLVTIGIILGAIAGSKDNAFDLVEGDCVENTDRLTSFSLSDLTPIPCSEPHEAQVVGTVDVGDEGDRYPGESALRFRGSLACSELAGDVQAANPQLTAQLILPDDDLWDDQDNRKIVCILTSTTKQTGSVFD